MHSNYLTEIERNPFTASTYNGRFWREFGSTFSLRNSYRDPTKERKKCWNNTAKPKSEKNCRIFYCTIVCPEGTKCPYRHEYRPLHKIRRYYWVCHLMKQEYLQFNVNEQQCPDLPDKDGIQILPVFKKIHALESETEDDVSTSECSQRDEDSPLTLSPGCDKEAN